MTAPTAQRLIVVANRLPVRHVGEGARAKWVTSPGGLVTALHPVLRAAEGAWVGWDGTTTKNKNPKARRPFTHDDINIRPVYLTKTEYESFYSGFCNGTLWPLYHDCIREPRFHRRWWRAYEQVNQRFAQAAIETARDGDLIWVQDYQLQLVPALVRKALPRSRIGFFLHIPFPPEELFAKMPWRRQILEGLLAADVVGFQTKLGAQNFSRAARQFTPARGSDAHLEYHGRPAQARAFPISIDQQRFRDAAASPGVQLLAEHIRERLGDRRIVLGVDRLDYTKGVDLRLRAFEETLARGNISVDDTVFVQIAVPTREAVEEYENLRRVVDEHVGRINGSFAEIGKVAVHYLYSSVPFEELLAYYRAADVMMITPYRDGMNLVAKEFVATRLDNSGVLILSEFAGAALEFRQSLQVNPYDIDGIADAIEHALAMPLPESRRRMAAMRRTVARNDVYRWSDSFLKTLDA